MRHTRTSTEEGYQGNTHEAGNVQQTQTSTDSATVESITIFISYLLLIVFFPLAIFVVLKVLTKDSVTILIDGCVFYYIVDPILAITKITDYRSSTGLLAATILRNVVGMKNLKQILMDRKGISESIQKLLDEGTDPWGIKVMRVELQEIMLPLQMQRAMATEAEAEREAKAKVIAADGELHASRTLKQASDVIAQGSMALQLRYLQTLATLTTEKKSVIIFPVPVDILPKSH